MMETLRAFFQMGSVECVTCQVPRSHGSGGGVNVVAVAVAVAVLGLVVGARSVIWGWEGEAVGSGVDMVWSNLLGDPELRMHQ